MRGSLTAQLPHRSERLPHPLPEVSAHVCKASSVRAHGADGMRMACSHACAPCACAPHNDTLGASCRRVLLTSLVLLPAAVSSSPAGAAVEAGPPKMRLLDTVTPMSAIADKDYGKTRIQ